MADTIAYSGKIPAGASLLLGVPDAANAIDVTHMNPNDLIDAKNQAIAIPRPPAGCLSRALHNALQRYST
jgi:hypothetical protein